MDSFLLDIITCPECSGGLRFTKEEVLVCLNCRKGYPVKNGAPDLRSVVAIPLKPQTVTVTQKIVFLINNKNEQIETYLEPHTCRLIGRQSVDDEGTKLININGMAHLDDGLKKIVSSYIQKQFKQKEKQLTEKGYERLPDILLSDASVSRMQAMLFFDGQNVGVLDLVSRNGTYINGREIETGQLAADDQLMIGDTVIKIVS